MATGAEVAAMRRAIAISAAGLGTTSPNPPVGCVLLSPEGQIIGEGYHERKGDAHAEVRALAAAGGLARHSTAVVTLEPCNHQGRTPACRQALIDAHVKRVVIAVTDPTSRGEGGTAVLRATGIEVETGVLEREAHVVLGAWLTATRASRPVTIWPYVIGDAAITPLPGDTGEALTLRMNADAVLHADGSVSEAAPAAHGDGILRLPDQVDADDPHRTAALLFRGGVRCLLLSGGLDLAAPFLEAGMVDQVVAYLPHGSSSRRLRTQAPWPLLPPGFVITGATRIPGFVRVRAQTETSVTGPEM